MFPIVFNGGLLKHLVFFSSGRVETVSIFVTLGEKQGFSPDETVGAFQPDEFPI